MTRLRDLGIAIGNLPTGANNAITDVDGVRVGYVTLIEGVGARVRGEGPFRTGVTVIIPHDEVGTKPLFAGAHRLNGNGELTGLEWVRCHPWSDCGHDPVPPAKSRGDEPRARVAVALAHGRH